MKKSKTLKVLIFLIFSNILFARSVEDLLKEKPVYETKAPSGIEEIEYLGGSYVYSGKNIDLRNYQVKEKKEAFIELLLPTIDVVEAELMWKRSILEELKGKKELSTKEQEMVDDIIRPYKAKSIEGALNKMVMPPKSLILSQGALESGWGTSRFFREGNNIFGVWSYNKSEPRIEAGKVRANGTRAAVKSYEDLKGAVEDYVILIGRAYPDVREAIKAGKGSQEAALGLLRYSELREEYIEMVKSLIRINKLENYDK